MIHNELINRILSSIILISLSIFFIIKGDLFFICFILVLLFISIYEWYLMTKNTMYKLLGIIFLIISFYSSYLLRMEMDLDYIYFTLVLSICILTDIGGYIFGKIIQGPKLTKISPKKTYAGAIGGYFCSIAIISLVFTYVDKISEVLNINLLLKNFQFNIFIFIFLISTVSQFGDIFVSYFKRQSNIKNTGKIIPGHGGLLDRIDGMIFAYPIAYLITNTSIFKYL